MAQFDAKNLSTLDWVVVGTAVLALIALFLPWYGVSTLGLSASVSGWSTGYGWIGAALIVGGGVYLVVQRSQVDLSRRGLGPASTVLGLTVVGTFLVIIRWITLPRGHSGVGGITLVSYGPRVGIVLALIVGVVQVGCALSLFRRSGERPPWSS